MKDVQIPSFNFIKFYNGIVDEVGDNYTIRWRVPEILDNLDKYPIAYPLSKHISEILPNDKVLIIQPDSDIQDFYYIRADDSLDTYIKYKECLIDLSDGKSIKINVGKVDEDDPHLLDKLISSIEVKDDGSTTILSNDSDGNNKCKIVINNDGVVIDMTQSGKIKIKNQSASMKNILDTVQTVVANLVTPGNLVAPNGPVTYNQAGGDLPKMNQLKVDIKNLMEE